MCPRIPQSGSRSAFRLPLYGVRIADKTASEKGQGAKSGKFPPFSRFLIDAWLRFEKSIILSREYIAIYLGFWWR
jgi:hypothetical protein